MLVGLKWNAPVDCVRHRDAAQIAFLVVLSRDDSTQLRDHAIRPAAQVPYQIVFAFELDPGAVDPGGMAVGAVAPVADHTVDGSQGGNGLVGGVAEARHDLALPVLDRGEPPDGIVAAPFSQTDTVGDLQRGSLPQGVAIHGVGGVAVVNYVAGGLHFGRHVVAAVGPAGGDAARLGLRDDPEPVPGEVQHLLHVRRLAFVETTLPVVSKPGRVAERIDVTGRVEPRSVLDVVVESMERILSPNRSHLLDATTRVGVLDAFALGVDDRRESGSHVLVAGSGPAAGSVESITDAHQPVSGVLDLRHAAGPIADRGDPSVHLVGDREDRLTVTGSHALIDRDRARLSGDHLRCIGEPWILRAGVVDGAETGIGGELVGESALGLHRVRIDDHPDGSGNRVARREGRGVVGDAGRIHEAGAVVADVEAPEPLLGCGVVGGADFAGAEMGIDAEIRAPDQQIPAQRTHDRTGHRNHGALLVLGQPGCRGELLARRWTAQGRDQGDPKRCNGAIDRSCGDGVSHRPSPDSGVEGSG